MQCQKATDNEGNQNRNKKQCTTTDWNHYAQGQVKPARAKPNHQQRASDKNHSALKTSKQ